MIILTERFGAASLREVTKARGGKPVPVTFSAITYEEICDLLQDRPKDEVAVHGASWLANIFYLDNSYRKATPYSYQRDDIVVIVDFVETPKGLPSTGDVSRLINNGGIQFVVLEDFEPAEMVFKSLPSMQAIPNFSTI